MKLTLTLIFSAAIVLLCPKVFAGCSDPLTKSWFEGDVRKELATLNFDQGSGIAQLSSKPLFTAEERNQIIEALKSDARLNIPHLIFDPLQVQFNHPLTSPSDPLKQLFGEPITNKLLSYLKELEDHLNESELFSKAEGKLVVYSAIVRAMDKDLGFRVDAPEGHVHGDVGYIDAIKAELGDGVITFQHGQQIQHPTAVTTLFTDGGRIAHLKRTYGTDFSAQQTRHKSPDIESDRLILLIVIHSEDWQKWTQARRF